MTKDIHFIERKGNLNLLDSDKGLWESGWWKVSQKTAFEVVGGNIYFHKRQVGPSFFGGCVTGFRVEDQGEWAGRILFTLIASDGHKNIVTESSGWGMEKKIRPHSLPRDSVGERAPIERSIIDDLRDTALRLSGATQGIYLLFSNKELVYIGRGWNCLLRVAEHTRKDSDKIFDSWNFMVFDDDQEMKNAEQRLIKEHKPKYNLQHNRN